MSLRSTLIAAAVVAATLALPASVADEECGIALVPTAVQPPPVTKNSLTPIRVWIDAVGGPCPVESFGLRLNGVEVASFLEATTDGYVVGHDVSERLAIAVPHTVEVTVSEECCGALGDPNTLTFTYAFVIH